MKRLLTVILSAIMLLAVGCGSQKGGLSDAESAEPAAAGTVAVSVEDITVMLGDTTVISPTFTGDRDAVSYSDYDEAVIKIRNGLIRPQSVGETSVTLRCDNAGLTCTFTVTVTEEKGASAVEAFCAAGTFDLPDALSLWQLTGETAGQSVLEPDIEGGNETNAFKLWVSENGPIDITMTYVLPDMPAGDYTFTLNARAGALDELLVMINGTEYRWSQGQIALNRSTSYLVYTLPADGDITFALTAGAASGNAGWGYLDNIAVEMGDTAPDVVVSSDTVNYSFEEGLNGWTLTPSEPFAGAVTAYSTTAAATGVYAVNYWGAAGKADAFTLSQRVIGLTEGTYTLSVMLIVGCDRALDRLQSAYLYIRNYDGQGGELRTDVSAVTGWNEGVLTRYEIAGIPVTAQEAEVGLYLQMGEDTVWIHLDDLILERD